MIDKHDPNTWKPAFDHVIERLERDMLPEHVDEFDMGTVVGNVIEDTGESCGTAACLFGSAALAVGWSDHAVIRGMFKEWKPSDDDMKEIYWICMLADGIVEEIVRAYRIYVG